MRLLPRLRLCGRHARIVDQGASADQTPEEQDLPDLPMESRRAVIEAADAVVHA